MKQCYICGGDIDRGACGEQHSIITIKDDRHNRGKEPEEIEPMKTTRDYLCSICSYRLKIFLRTQRAEWRSKHIK